MALAADCETCCLEYPFVFSFATLCIVVDNPACAALIPDVAIFNPKNVDAIVLPPILT